MLDLNDMYYFVQVVDHKSITAAARALALPKSTLSYRVNQLEAQLGVRLINRTSRQFAVTEIGAEFYAHARSMLQEAIAAEAVVRQRMLAPSGLVRMSTAVATAQFALRSLLPRFCERFPKVRLMQRLSDVEVDIVAEGFDIAIRAHSQPLQDSTLIQRPLAPTPWMLFSSPSFFDGAKLPEQPEDIAERRSLFMVREGVPYEWTLRRDDIVRTVRVSPVLMTSCMLTLKDAAVAGLGIVALPGYVCNEELADGRLMRVLPEWTCGDAQLTALVPFGQNQLPSVRALLDYLVQEVPLAVSTEGRARKT
ncbi:LysR substrate-binding domain-containing protein [Paraburkholderia sp. ZP32-5]|uniref:LysR substrate-binding domain-containing protein n=1 Tax=Paraburkholderia sp. ZP32-5 TaxID=2883245 RepID=UPI001F1AA263|nr:LysR substrate-binding domain-containing protein [Paraburkholderia sp. ZP32-5]